MTNFNVLNFLLILSFFLFSIGILGAILVRRNVLIIMIAIELMLLSVALSFAVGSIYLDDIVGEMFFLFIISLAGAEASVGLSILIIFYRLRGIISLKYMNALKG